MSETVQFWVDEFIAENKNVTEEIEDVKCAISNERLWAKGAETEESVYMHEQNVAELEEYLEWLEEQQAA